MTPDIYFILVVLYTLIYLGNKQTLLVESFCIFILLVIAPEKMFFDLPNYVSDALRDYDWLPNSINARNLEYYYRLAYDIAYPVCYYLFARTFKADSNTRLLFFIFSFFTLGLNQLYLCAGLSSYFLYRQSDRIWLKCLFLGYALFAHLSIFVLLIYDLYKIKPKWAIISAVAVIGLLFYNPMFYLKFAGLDDRIEFFSDLTEWQEYTIRSQVYSFVCLAIVGIFNKDRMSLYFLLGIFAFGLSVMGLHGVFARRFIELLFYGWIFTFHKKTPTTYSMSSILLFKLILIVFFVKNSGAFIHPL